MSFWKNDEPIDYRTTRKEDKVFRIAIELLQPIADKDCENERFANSYINGSGDTCQSVLENIDEMCEPCQAFTVCEDLRCRLP